MAATLMAASLPLFLLRRGVDFFFSSLDRSVMALTTESGKRDALTVLDPGIETIVVSILVY